MQSGSFYESTGRENVSSAGVLAAQRSYTYNYLALLPESRDAVIVDLGCSEGISLEWLLMNGYRNVVGVDSDSVAIKHAEKRLGGKLNEGRIIFGDAYSYLEKCEDASIDMVVMFNVIEHIPKDVIPKMVYQIHRVLKKGGGFLAQTGNWENPFNIGLFTRDFTHHVMYTKNSMRQLMVLSGFHKTSVLVMPLSYKLTIRNAPLFILAPFCGWLLKAFAACMRMRIQETSPLIYCFAKK